MTTTRFPSLQGPIHLRRLFHGPFSTGGTYVSLCPSHAPGHFRVSLSEAGFRVLA